MFRRSVALAALLLVGLLAGCVPGDLYPTPTPTSPTAPPSPSPSPSTPSPSPSDGVISSVVTHEFATPSQGNAFVTQHDVPVPVLPPPAPPLPCLISVAAGAHPEESPAYDQLSFRFTGAFPSYAIVYVPSLMALGTGEEVPLPGATAILRVEFTQAQAHNEDGSSCTESSPPTPIGSPAIQTSAQAGDFEGTVRYGIGVGMGSEAPDGQARVRVVEVERNAEGQHTFTVAVQVARAE